MRLIKFSFPSNNKFVCRNGAYFIVHSFNMCIRFFLVILLLFLLWISQFEFWRKEVRGAEGGGSIRPSLDPCKTHSFWSIVGAFRVHQIVTNGKLGPQCLQMVPNGSNWLPMLTIGVLSISNEVTNSTSSLELRQVW